MSERDLHLLDWLRYIKLLCFKFKNWLVSMHQVTCTCIYLQMECVQSLPVSRSLSLSPQLPFGPHIQTSLYSYDHFGIRTWIISGVARKRQTRHNKISLCSSVSNVHAFSHIHMHTPAHNLVLNNMYRKNACQQIIPTMSNFSITNALPN